MEHFSVATSRTPNSLKIAQNGIEGIGFAIPSNDLIPLVEEMIDKGEITRPYLGVGLAHLSEIPSGYLGALPEDIKGGAVITTVEPGINKFYLYLIWLVLFNPCYSHCFSLFIFSY